MTAKPALSERIPNYIVEAINRQEQQTLAAALNCPLLPTAQGSR